MKLRNVVVAVAFTGVALAVAPYVDQKDRFRLQYDEAQWEVVALPTAPAKETVDTSMAEQTLVTLQRKTADDKYRARFNVITDDTSKVKKVAAAGTQEKKLEAYRDHSVAFMKSQRFDILSTEKTKFQGREAFQVLANQRDFGLSFKQIGFLEGDKAYLLTVTARTAKFETYLPEFNALIDSFKLK